MTMAWDQILLFTYILNTEEQSTNFSAMKYWSTVDRFTWKIKSSAFLMKIYKEVKKATPMNRVVTPIVYIITARVIRYETTNYLI